MGPVLAIGIAVGLTVGLAMAPFVTLHLHHPFFVIYPAVMASLFLSLLGVAGGIGCGGEPLVRYRELGRILPELAARGIHSQVVTSAVRPIPEEWKQIPRLQIVVSIDGLPADVQRGGR